MAKAGSSSIREMSSLDISSMANFKGTDALSPSPISTKDSLRMGSITARGNTLGVLEMSMKGHMKMGRSTVLESIRVLTGLSTKETGRTERETERAYKFLLQG